MAKPCTPTARPTITGRGRLLRHRLAGRRLRHIILLRRSPADATASASGDGRITPADGGEVRPPARMPLSRRGPAARLEIIRQKLDAHRHRIGRHAR